MKAHTHTFVVGTRGKGTYEITHEVARFVRECGVGTGTVRLILVDNDTVHDLATNTLRGAGVSNGTFINGETVAVDRSSPSVTSIARLDPATTHLGSVRYRVTFSETVPR